MKKLILISTVTLLAVAGCVTQSPRPETVGVNSVGANGPPGALKPQIDLVKVDNTIARLKAEIQELDSLETQIYANSVKGDKTAIKALNGKIERYGTIESLQTNLRVLEELKAESPGLSRL